MRVILLEDVKKQGKKGQTISVKDGYGNYLITNNLAVLETKGSKAVLDKQNKDAKEASEKLIQECQNIKEKLAKITLEFKVKTGEGDKVFGSISIKQIKDELQKQGFKVEKSCIEITNPISSLGFHNVNINLYPEVVATIKVHVIK